MNQSLISLQKIAQKKSRVILGLMSGTSLDGLDIALCDVSGMGIGIRVEMKSFTTVEYNTAQKNLLRQITSVETVKLRDLCYIHTRLAMDHGDMINGALKKWGVESAEVDCIASHGQTIYHLPARDQSGDEPAMNSTLQIADGDHIAAGTGIITLSDFRQKHTARGGEGAPMAALVDRILFGSDTESRILLNIGGIANYTLLPASQTPDQTPFTTDTGPGNTLIDNVVQHYFNKPYDKDGQIASQGTVRPKLLELLLGDKWFRESGSKSTGPEYFNLEWIRQTLRDGGADPASISPHDLVATVTELSVNAIADSIKSHCADYPNATIYASGGGARNPVLVGRIQEQLPGHDVHNFSDLGMDPDAKEAVIFAVLANEMLAGEGFPLETGTGTRKVNFGKISFP